MKIPCKKCGRTNSRKKEKRIIDWKCSNCSEQLLTEQINTIVSSCSNCSTPNHIQWNQFGNWNCKSCLVENQHPSMVAICGNGNASPTPLLKTTINFERDVIKVVDNLLAKYNKKTSIRIKRGEFIRLILKKEFGFMF